MIAYSTFETQVKTALGELADVAGYEDQLSQLIKFAALEIIDKVRELRPDASVTITPEETITAEGEYATLFELPDARFVKITEVFTVDSDSSEDAASSNRTGPYSPVGWDQRFNMLYGRSYECSHVYCLHPDGVRGFLHPALPADKLLVVHYEAWDPELLPASSVRLPQKAVEAAAAYVRARYFTHTEPDALAARTNDREFKDKLKSIASTVRAA